MKISNETKIGALTVISITILILGYSFLRGNDIFSGSNKFYAVYNSVEGGNGELGYYLISDGGRQPFRLHFRRPCYIYYQAYAEMIKGSFLSDAILTMSSMNVIAGELDS